MDYEDFSFPEVPTQENTHKGFKRHCATTSPGSPCEWNKDSRYSSFYFSFVDSKEKSDFSDKIRTVKSSEDLYIERKNFIKELDKIKQNLKNLNLRLSNQLSTVIEKNEEDPVPVPDQKPNLQHLQKSEIFLNNSECTCLNFCHIY